MTGVLLLSVYIYFDRDKIKFSSTKRYVMGIASLITFSTTAWLLFVFYYLLKRANKLIFPLILIIVSIGMIYLSEFWGRFSIGYIEAVYDIKVDEINNNIEYVLSSKLSYLFGTSYVQSENAQVKGYGNLVGDFSYLDFYLRNGIVGVIIFSLFSYFNLNKYNFAMVLILIIGTFHYHVIFSFPGQIFFAYFLSLNKKDKNLNLPQLANNTCQAIR